MSNNTFQIFIEKIAAKGRISFGDVRRLQRDVLPDGIASREEAEALIGLDRSVTRVDPAWTEWLVSALVDFVVYVERPTGTVHGDKADWATAALCVDGRPTKTARLIAREIAREAQSVDEAVIAVGMGADTGAVSAIPCEDMVALAA
jgi:hypothetical protein